MVSLTIEKYTNQRDYDAMQYAHKQQMRDRVEAGITRGNDEANMLYNGRISSENGEDASMEWIWKRVEVVVYLACMLGIW